MSSKQRRVVITGIGLVSPLGSSKEALWEALRQARSGVGPLTVLPPGAVPVHVAAEARQFTGEIEDFGPLEKEQKKQIRKALRVMCRECQMGVAVAQLALTDAAIQVGTIDPDRIGISYGTDYMLSLPEEFNEGIRQCLEQRGEIRVSPLGPRGPAQNVAAVAAQVSAQHARQPRGDFQRSSRAEQFADLARGRLQPGRRRGLSDHPPRKCRRDGLRGDRHATARR